MRKEVHRAVGTSRRHICVTIGGEQDIEERFLHKKTASLATEGGVRIEHVKKS